MFLALLLLAGTAWAASPDDTLRSLPPEVQKTVKAEIDQRTILKVDAKERQGEKRYKVVMKAADGLEKRLIVDAHGKILRTKQDVVRDSLPQPVAKTVDAQGAGQFVRSTRVDHDGLTEYEAEFDVSGKSKEILTDSAGKLERIEEVVAIAAVPAQAEAEIEKDVGKNKLLKIEAITETGKPTVYEAQFEADGKKSEIQIGSDGKVLGRE
jgi:uncharacterized membrane protein YkoI